MSTGAQQGTGGTGPDESSTARPETDGVPPLADDRPYVDGTAVSAEELRAEVERLSNEERQHVDDLREEVGDSLAELASRFDVKARVAEVAGTWSGVPAFLCECSNTDCTESVALSRPEYETVRSSPNQFVVLPGHQLPQVDRVLEANDRCCLVEKTKHTELVLAWHRDTPTKEG